MRMYCISSFTEECQSISSGRCSSELNRLPMHSKLNNIDNIVTSLCMIILEEKYPEQYNNTKTKKWSNGTAKNISH